jgi:hypothetical protein
LQKWLYGVERDDELLSLIQNKIKMQQVIKSLYDEVSRRINNLIESIPVTPPGSPLRGSVQAMNQSQNKQSRRTQTRNLLIIATLAIVTVLQIISLFSNRSSLAPPPPPHAFAYYPPSTADTPNSLLASSSSSISQSSSSSASSNSPDATFEDLTPKDRMDMERLFNFGNFTSFVKLSEISGSLQKHSSASVTIPCLWSELLQKNIYLIPGDLLQKKNNI